MAKPNSYTAAKQAISALLRDARDAGWYRAGFEIQPDGSVTIDAVMADIEPSDDFLNTELRMTK